jgi:hypothetical protein
MMRGLKFIGFYIVEVQLQLAEQIWSKRRVSKNVYVLWSNLVWIKFGGYKEDQA